jgi:tetratricopeptide (TPR) repeat protein
MKRIKRRQLKKDEFVTSFNRAVRFFNKRKKEIFACAGLAAVIFLVFAGIKWIGFQSLKKESRLLAEIFDLQSGLNSKPENVAKLEKLARGGKFSRVAHLVLAAYWMEAGDNAKAQAALEEIPQGRKDLVYYQAQDLLAQVHLQQKNYDRAIDIYKRIEQESPKNYSLDVVLFHRAEAHQGKGEVDQALAIYKRVQDEFPQTYYGFDASQKLKNLQAKK